jgi:hypothetical protein
VAPSGCLSVPVAASAALLGCGNVSWVFFWVGYACCILALMANGVGAKSVSFVALLWAAGCLFAFGLMDETPGTEEPGQSR